MTGSVDTLPSGRKRARRGGRSIGTFATEAEAWAALESGTLSGHWVDFRKRRKAAGARDVRNEENRWELYVETDPIAAVRFPKLTRKDAVRWLARMLSRGLAVQTVKNALNLVRVVCADAVALELLAANPFIDVEIPKTFRGRSDDGWTVLDPEEQLALLDAVSADEAAMVTFALHTGLRSSELWRLRTADIDLDAREVVVRFSRAGRPTKSGKVRRVPLFGAGLEAARVAVERGNEYAWPAPRTEQRRRDSSKPTRWRKWLRAAGITRRVRWYDLRHTCATSLLAGWWGRKWSLDEVRRMLGHASVQTTERYAHILDDSIRRAAETTVGVTRDKNGGADFGIRTRDLRFTKPSDSEAFSRIAIRQHVARSVAPNARFTAALLRGVRAAFARDKRGTDAALVEAVELREQGAA